MKGGGLKEVEGPEFRAFFFPFSQTIYECRVSRAEGPRQSDGLPREGN